MPSNLERRLATLESSRARYRSAAECTDAELLALMGWKGQQPPTDEELRAIANGERGERHVTAA